MSITTEIRAAKIHAASQGMPPITSIELTEAEYAEFHYLTQVYAGQEWEGTIITVEGMV